jgi:hypothetical protein
MGSEKASLRVHLSPADACTRAEQAVRAIGGRIELSDRERSRLEAHIPWSLWSRGERLQVELSPVDGDVVVQVKSQSTIPIFIDWGRNAENVNRVLDAVTPAPTLPRMERGMSREKWLIIAAAVTTLLFLAVVSGIFLGNSYTWINGFVVLAALGGASYLWRRSSRYDVHLGRGGGSKT